MCGKTLSRPNASYRVGEVLHLTQYAASRNCARMGLTALLIERRIQGRDPPNRGWHMARLARFVRGSLTAEPVLVIAFKVLSIHTSNLASTLMPPLLSAILILFTVSSPSTTLPFAIQLFCATAIA